MYVITVLLLPSIAVAEQAGVLFKISVSFAVPTFLSQSVGLKALCGVKAVGTSASRAAGCCPETTGSLESLICRSV